MKNPKRRTPGKPTIYLIAEDKAGFYVLREIIRRRGIWANLTLRGQAQGIFKLAHELRELIHSVLEEMKERDCIIVLHDWDEMVQPNRDSYEHIAGVCKDHDKQVTLVIARQEIEAWLLADVAFCEWLGIEPSKADSKNKPSVIITRLLRENMGKRWDDKVKEKEIPKMDASGINLSESMRLAVDTLHKLPCTQQKEPATG